MIGDVVQVPALPCYKIDRNVGPEKVLIGYIPVLLPMHTDEGLLKTPGQHFHVDWRFPVPKLWDDLNLTAEKSLKVVFVSDEERDSLTMVPMTQIREAPTYPAVWWKKPLGEQYKHCRMRNMKCPHKGVKLNADGSCPAHGLKWNTVTGELIC